MSLPGKFRTDYKEGDPLVTAALNSIGQFLNGIGIVGGHISKNSRGSITFHVKPGDGGGVIEGLSIVHAWKTAALEIFDPENEFKPFDPPRFGVHVLAGTAQAIGGAEKAFLDQDFNSEQEEPEEKYVEDGEWLYVEYQLWDENGAPIEEWVPKILHAHELPVKTNKPKSQIFAIARISKNYRNNVNQLRFSSIETLVNEIAAQMASDITVRDLVQ